MDEMTLTPYVDWSGVFAAPPLARRSDNWALDWTESGKVVEHLLEGGVSRVYYGEHAQLQHLTLGQYRDLLAWLDDFSDELTVIPGLGPPFGRAYQQAEVLSQHSFPCAAVLPVRDDRDPAGMELGYRKLAERAEMPLLVVIRDVDDWGREPHEVADRLERMREDELVAAVSFAIPPTGARAAPLLRALGSRLSDLPLLGGLGEHFARSYLVDHDLPGFISPAACLAPRLCRKFYLALDGEDRVAADSLASNFEPLRQLSEAWGSVGVHHAAIHLAGIADMGPVLPYLSGLTTDQGERLRPVVRTLLRQHQDAEVRRPGLT